MTILLERHKRAKQQIIDRLHELSGIASKVGMSSLASDIIQTRIPKIENERFHLVVLGEFNHGKTTFVNALLGDDILPTGITPTTAAINHVVWSPARRAKVVLKSGDEVDLVPESLSEWVTVRGNKSADVRFVELAYPAEILREHVTLVDTPGVNDLNEQRAEITFGYVPRADAVIFLLDAGQALKDSEREFLSGHVLASTKDRLIFVIGKIDLLSEQERAAVIDYVREGLSQLVDQPVVFPISAREWLVGNKDASGMNQLLEYLSRFLDTDRAQVLLDNAAIDAGRIAGYLQQNLGVKLRSYDLDLKELEERITQVRNQLDTSKRTLDELHMRIAAETEAIKAQCRLDLENFVRAFVQALPHQIDSADASDIKEYLPGFVEDKFREWAELEGIKLAALLERLAEEVIAVTNENVEAVSAALASRLGPEDTAVDIDVDTFKYDLGVYAVGALGTTVFLFVSTLVGGLLTLAAPILAIVIRSKVAGDIREQAKKKVPDAIIRAGDAMRPHFDRCVDDFATRLKEFVTSAGNALYRGISEILDQAIEERRLREGDTDNLRVETGEQVATVNEVRSSLVELRKQIWDAPPPAASGS